MNLSDELQGDAYNGKTTINKIEANNGIGLKPSTLNLESTGKGDISTSSLSCSKDLKLIFGRFGRSVGKQVVKEMKYLLVMGVNRSNMVLNALKPRSRCTTWPTWYRHHALILYLREDQSKNVLPISEWIMYNTIC